MLGESSAAKSVLMIWVGSIFTPDSTWQILLLEERALPPFNFIPYYIFLQDDYYLSTIFADLLEYMRYNYTAYVLFKKLLLRCRNWLLSKEEKMERSTIEFGHILGNVSYWPIYQSCNRTCVFS